MYRKSQIEKLQFDQRLERKKIDESRRKRWIRVLGIFLNKTQVIIDQVTLMLTKAIESRIWPGRGYRSLIPFSMQQSISGSHPEDVAVSNHVERLQIYTWWKSEGKDRLTIIRRKKLIITMDVPVLSHSSSSTRKERKWGVVMYYANCLFQNIHSPSQ